jgi:hypothetical protein
MFRNMKSQAAEKRQRRRGRPSKYTPANVRRICDAIADGVPLKYAAALGGISHETLCQWQRQFPEFSEAVEKAKARGVHERLKIIRAAAKRGNVRAAQWWLERVCPEFFGARLVAAEAPGQEVPGRVVVYLPKKERLPDEP